MFTPEPTMSPTSLPRRPAQRAGPPRSKYLQPGPAFVPFAMDAVEQSIAARFESQVERHPQRPALQTTTQQWTYEALNRYANRVARALLTLRGPGQEPVAL